MGRRLNKYELKLEEASKKVVANYNKKNISAKLDLVYPKNEEERLMIKISFDEKYPHPFKVYVKNRMLHFPRPHNHALNAKLSSEYHKLL